jgi:uncharacterized protein
MKNAIVRFGQTGNVEAYVQIARTADELTTGLSNTLFLGPDAGLLLDFGAPRLVKIWMRGMHFPLDLVFLSELHGAPVVRAIAANVPYWSRAIYEQSQTRWVLEVNAGWCARHDLVLGESAIII